jgi:hypothetical protein
MARRSLAAIRARLLTTTDHRLAMIQQSAAAPLAIFRQPT